MEKLSELVFVGIGLYDEKDLSLRAVEEIKSADKVFAELYTSLLPAFNVKRLETLVGKKVVVVSRKILEDDEGRQILQETKGGKVVFLVPGDPLIATTHVDLRIRAEKMGVKTRIVHGASIISAVIGLTGLQNYKFGRSVTVPFLENSVVADTSYRVVMENRQRGLHTLCFLDLKAEEKRHMTVKEGLRILLEVEEREKKEVVTSKTLAVGVARAGAPNFCIKADYVKDLLQHNFGDPPHALVFPGKLHFMEAEALVSLAGAPRKILEMT
ncbi:diphthine synthase [Candidatus Bathyarchaeota archaeon A05DMB-4]|jgi:diphthine synthase|nr:diphthine synthase [Candidatus Bathyarchaeota archaeon A05DMB-4]